MNTDFNISGYHKILCPSFPEFLNKYLELPLLCRLKGIGLLCGTDWTPLFSNNFFYSRFDHSVGCALITWNFTHDKGQTVAALLHDVSTPAFSHVGDFRKGDALTQTATENDNAALIRNDTALAEILAADGLCAGDVDDYHRFPICDNEIPGLSADRLEYMFPSGAALSGNWNMKEIESVYSDICICRNEEGVPELGFSSVDAASLYFTKFMETALFLQTNTDKIAMQLLAETVNKALECGQLEEAGLFTLSESEIFSRWDYFFKEKSDGTANVAEKDFLVHYRTFRTMTAVCGSAVPLDGYFCVSLKVKKRYINPLVGKERLCSLNKEAGDRLRTFMEFEDTPYACVRFAGLE